MKEAIFHIKRDVAKEDTTLGILYDHQGHEFCFTLEDVVRAYGVKDKGNTAIPATEEGQSYFLRVMLSKKYGKVVTVYSEIRNGIPVLINGGIEFSYIRCHGGNDAEDTEGCPLINKNRDVDKMKAWGSMRGHFTSLIEKLTNEGYDCRLKVTNLPQAK